MSGAPKAASLALSDARPIWQSLLIFLVPLMLSNILQSLSGTLNSIYLGRLVGVRSLAAVSAIFPIVFFLISFVIGLGSGSTVLIGQAYGARDAAKVKEIAGTTLALALGLGLVVGVLGGTFTELMLAAIGTPSDILQMSASYSRILFFSLPVLFGYLIYTTFLRGTGDARTPFYTLLASTALTMAVTPAFILGWLGLPRLETNAAAVGNVLSTALAFGGLLLYLALVKHPLALDRAMIAGMRVRWDIAAKVVRLGLPSAVNLVMISLSEVAVLFFVNHFGSTATAAYGAVNQVTSYVQFPAVSIGIGASIFGAQAIGAGRLERIGAIVRSAVVLNYIVEGVLVTLGYLFSIDLISLFIRQPQTVAIAHSLLLITLWSYPIYGNARVLAGIMLSSGSVLWPTALSILSIWGVEVPVAYVLMQRMGLDGVWYGYPAAFIAGLLFQLTYYYAVWRRRPLERLV